MVTNNVTYHQPVSAYVIFSDHTDQWWLRGLRRGFRHCYVALPMGGHMVLLDPVLGQMRVVMQDELSVDQFINHLRSNGLNIVFVDINYKNINFPILAIDSCVAIIKRILGLSAPFIITPYQLYHYLLRHCRGNHLSILSP
jgi:hypothetical protein